MFRLVKVINSNTQCETHFLSFDPSTEIGAGCAVSAASGFAESPTATSSPDYVSLSSTDIADTNKIPAILVTEDMIFRVEYTGSIAAVMGMNVGLATKENKMDSVTYNNSGKGTIVGLDDDKRFVYVRFRK